MIERMMGVRYTRVAGVPAWHPDVQAYAVSDAASGTAAGHAVRRPVSARRQVQPRRRLGLDSQRRPRLKRVPQAALVVNFDRKGLTLEEIETLLHELGHAVHNNLSATRHALQAGTSVKRDFVEAPSQMLEDWVYDTPAC